jgi:hypothetical protein
MISGERDVDQYSRSIRRLQLELIEGKQNLQGICPGMKRLPGTGGKPHPPSGNSQLPRDKPTIRRPIFYRKYCIQVLVFVVIEGGLLDSQPA